MEANKLQRILSIIMTTCCILVFTSKIFGSIDTNKKPILSTSISVPLDMDLFQNIVKKVSGAMPMEYSGKNFVVTNRNSIENKKVVRDYLAKRFAEFGFHISEQAYPTGVNLIADKKGISEKVLIISAHLDTVDNAGANDNGTGIAALIAMAKYFQNKNFQNGLRLVLFDEEENQMLGSRGYLEKLEASKSNGDVIAMFQFDMIGTNQSKDGSFHIIDCGLKNSVVYAKKIMDAVSELKLTLHRQPACTTRSDHQIFWEHNIPALLISENIFMGDQDRCYHKKCDVFDSRLDFSYSLKIVQAVTRASEKILKLL